MKNDPKEQAKQLSLNFDSEPIRYGKETYPARPVGLVLAYSSGSIGNARQDISERDLIISQAVSFARKLSW